MKSSSAQVGDLALNESGAFKIGPFGSSLKKSELVDAGIPVAGIENVLPNQFVKGFRRFVTPRKFEDLSDYAIRADDVLVTTMGTIGRAAVAPSGLGRAIIDSHLFRMRVDTKRVFPPYLCYALNSDHVAMQLSRNARGAIMDGLNTSILRSCSIPLPSIPHQQRIARTLEKADRLRRTRGYALELSDAFIPAVFLELFGDPNGFKQSSIADFVDNGAILKVEDGNHGEAYPRSCEFGTEGIPFLTATNVSDGEVRMHEASRLPEPRAKLLRIGWIRPDDVLLSHNATVGRVAVVPDFVGQAVVGTSLTFYRLKKERFVSRFFAGMLSSRFFQRQLEALMKQTTRNQVPITRQFGLRLFEPPLATQEQFAKLAARHERLRAVQRESLRQAEHLFQTLLHRAFANDA